MEMPINDVDTLDETAEIEAVEVAEHEEHLTICRIPF